MFLFEDQSPFMSLSSNPFCHGLHSDSTEEEELHRSTKRVKDEPHSNRAVEIMAVAENLRAADIDIIM